MKKLFLLDGMALVYRAHFALMARPIFTSTGVNTSALYGFTQTLLELLRNQKPTHIALAMDTEAPTQRHKEFPEYKIQRQAMPEDIAVALPNVARVLEAFRIPMLVCDGYEADDIIGTLVRQAEPEGFISYMVSQDKDLSQLITEKTFLYKPSRMGDAVEVWGLPEVLGKWNIQRPEQVADILALWGDLSDNIPGVPGIGEKTASKLIGQYGSVENLLAHTSELKGKLKETLETHREQALLSKRLSTICRDCPCPVNFDDLQLREPDHEKLKALFLEFEFNTIGRRIYGDDFKAPAGLAKAAAKAIELEAQTETPATPGPTSESLPQSHDLPHEYHRLASNPEFETFLTELQTQQSFSLALETTGGDLKTARIVGLAFSWKSGRGSFIPLPDSPERAQETLNRLRPVLESGEREIIGHDLKQAFTSLRWHGVNPAGKLFDTMVAHSLIEPDLRHTLEHLMEVFLGYTLAPTNRPSSGKEELELMETLPTAIADRVVQRADLAWQLRPKLEPLLQQKGQERVFFEIEMPLLPVLVDMEFEGVAVDGPALAEIGQQLAKELDAQEKAICQIAGQTFNLNSPKQLGEILFDVLKICEGAKKTKTGQYATDEQTLLTLAPDHEIVRRLLDHRMLSKLKSTYVDALPTTIHPKTGRVHTTFQQTATATGRLNSQNPNLQNIPIRNERGKEIRRAFVPRQGDFELLSADYSQIELRIIAALSKETAMLDAFGRGLDIHTATAAIVYSVALEQVSSEMRRQAKMVNFGIAYGISAFGLSQRLGIARKDAGALIEQYFARFPGIRRYIDETIAFARANGYVQTVTGRRRYLRDINSANATTRNAAERNAINAPIQGTAADMIKLAMVDIQRELSRRRLKTKMILQVHDELLFDLCASEKEEVLPLVEEKMKRAIPLDVPIEVEMGTGKNWLEAH